MLVKMIYNEYDLRNEFIEMNRDYYSLDGYRALVDLFEECDCGSPTELDVIAICCDFNEEEPEDIIENYFRDEKDELIGSDGDIDINELMNKLSYYTWAQELGNGSIIYQAF